LPTGRHSSSGHNPNNEFGNTENFTDEQMERLERQFHALGKALGKGGPSDGKEASEAQPKAI
jgi:hypothetical protein